MAIRCSRVHKERTAYMYAIQPAVGSGKGTCLLGADKHAVCDGAPCLNRADFAGDRCEGGGGGGSPLHDFKMF